MGLSIAALLSKWLHRTSQATSEPTSSRASEGGLRPQARRLERPRVDRLLPLPALQHRRSGPRLRRPSAPLAWRFALIEQCRLQSSLESRLRAPTASSGSTLFQTDLKAQATPLGRPICALVASVPRTSGSGSTSWPSPTASLADKGVRTRRRADRSQAREESRPGGGGASGIVEHADAERARRQRGELLARKEAARAAGKSWA